MGDIVFCCDACTAAGELYGAPYPERTRCGCGAWATRAFWVLW